MAKANDPSEGVAGLRRFTAPMFIALAGVSMSMERSNLDKCTAGNVHRPRHLTIFARVLLTLTILALASPAFAFYYLLQCFVAFGISKSGAQRVGLLLLAAVLAFITVFAVPAG